MIQFTIITALFGLFYALKGGSGPSIFPWWERIRGKNKITERLLDGKVISTALVFVFALFATAETISANGGLYGVPEYAFQFLPATLFAAAWLLAVAPSMGEEHGAIGRIGKAWGAYIKAEKSFGREYGIKKGLQRGVWMGAFMALATGYAGFIVASLLFVPAVFVGQQLSWMLFKRDGWVLAEPIIGALVFGVPTALWLS